MALTAPSSQDHLGAPLTSTVHSRPAFLRVLIHASALAAHQSQQQLLAAWIASIAITSKEANSMFREQKRRLVSFQTKLPTSIDLWRRYGKIMPAQI